MPASRKKTNKSRSDTAVQGTNDSSIVSKFAMVQAGYFSDDYLQYMVQKTRARRSPLINRGYYIRAQAMDTLVREFLIKFGPDCQIISLGAGFDTTYFRLTGQQLLHPETSFIEIDFREVANRKARLICSESGLWTCLSCNKPPPIGENGPEVISCHNYRLLAVDLSDLSLVEACWRNLTARHKPTLLISECVMTYMSPKSSTSVITSAADYFTNAAFITYEQVYPDDAFGRVMTAHFRRLGATLRGIDAFPTPDDQEKRYIDAGWSEARCIPMTHFYKSVLTACERGRIRRLELFDEYEELHLKCGHYMIVCAEKGSCSDLYSSFQAARHEIIHPLPLTTPTVAMRPVFEEVTGLCRFGHDVSTVCDSDVSNVCGSSDVSNVSGSSDVSGGAQALTEDNDVVTMATTLITDDVVEVENGDVLVLTGGFGDIGGGRHSRELRHTVLDVRSRNTMNLTIRGENLIDRRMFHSATPIGSNQIVIFGGRSSPSRCFNDVIILHIEPTSTEAGNCSVSVEDSTDGGAENDVIAWFESVPVIGCRPCERYRHATLLVKAQDGRKLYICGGRTSDDRMLDDCWVYDVGHRVWSQISPLPSSRCSTHLAAWRTFLVLTGGLDDEERPLADILLYDLVNGDWRRFETKEEVQARFSHTSHVIDDDLYLLGGVSLTYPQPSLVRVDMLTASVGDYRLPVTDTPLMLHNHSSLEVKVKEPGTAASFVIIGGGGNCFSFGTHLNPSPVLMSVNK